MKKKTLTTAKLIRMTPAQLTKAKSIEFSYIVRCLADVWGTPRGKLLKRYIYDVVNEKRK